MKKHLITKINLYIDYTGQNKPIEETQTTFEVVKETKERFYFLGGKYTLKNNVHNITSKVECIKIDGKFKIMFNLTTYCNHEDVKSFQMLIRDEFLKQLKDMKQTVDGFNYKFNDNLLIESTSPYVNVTEKSEVIV